MKIVIHAGMHKTGSSSIQEYYSGNEFPALKYATWNQKGNHSGLFAMLFEDIERLPEFHGFKALGPDFCKTLPELRDKWRRSIENDLNNCGQKIFVFSAEAISRPDLTHAVLRMHDFFRQWTDDITVLAYVRRPLSFATSLFQQKLKAGNFQKLSMEPLWPAYKARFACIDKIFGRDRVILRPYDRGTLVGGDVVLDFASVLGVDIAEPPKVETNKTLSAEATALLYTQRRRGAGFAAGFERAHLANSAFIDALRGIGSRKLTFADSLWNPVLEENRADLEWIEERLGMPFRDKPAPDALAIAGEEDLFRLAVQNQPALETALVDALRKDRRPPLEKTINTLDLLQRFCYEPFSPP